MEKKKRKINYRIAATFITIILWVATIGVLLLPARTKMKKEIAQRHYWKNKTNTAPPDSICNIKKLWPAMLAHADEKKYFEIPGAGQVTLSGKVTRAGVDGLGIDCDSTFEINVDKAERATVQSYFKQAAPYKLLDSVIHCEIISSCPSGNDSIYKICNCTKPAMPRKGDHVQVTGKLLVDLHHVGVFRNFELHPVEEIKVIRSK